MAFFVYMLMCSDGTIYTGHTDNLETRLWQHTTGYFPHCYTFKRRPLSLLWSKAVGTRIEALEAERQIKGWTNAKKRALAQGDRDLVSLLARSRNTARVAHPSTGSGLTDLAGGIS